MIDHLLKLLDGEVEDPPLEEDAPWPSAAASIERRMRREAGLPQREEVGR